jgi:hypothetical protein
MTRPLLYQGLNIPLFNYHLLPNPAGAMVSHFLQLTREHLWKLLLAMSGLYEIRNCELL